MKIFLIISQVILFVSSQTINWHGNWAFNCDFHNSDLSNVQSRGEDCSSHCENTSGCTHYTWTDSNGGTCWMKYGPSSKNDAFYTDRNCVCGVISAIPPNNKFPYCQFKSGRSYDQPSTDYSGFDYVSIWIDTISPEYGTNFNPYYQGLMIDQCKNKNKIPVFYGYIIPFEARFKKQIQDCDVDPNNNLCNRGAEFIRENRQFLVDRYGYQASQISERLGRDNVAIFLIEPDFWFFIFIFLK